MKEKWHTGAFCDPHMQVNTSYTIRSLQKNGRSNHRNDHHYCAHDEPVSPDSPCPRRLIFLLLPIVCGSLCCPPEFFFLLGFLKFSHGLPLCYGAVVVVALAV